MISRQIELLELLSRQVEYKPASFFSETLAVSTKTIADIVIKVPAPTPKVDTETEFKSIQPMGSLFEQSLLLFLDIIILRLMEKQGNDSNTMFTRHANLQ